MHLPERHSLSGEVLGSHDCVRVVGRFHPFKAAQVDARLPSGLSVNELVDAALDGKKSGLTAEYIVYVDGEPVVVADRDRLRPPAGSTVTFSPRLQGGIDARSIAMLAVAVAALVVSTLLFGPAGFFGSMPLVASLVGAGIAVGGALAVNALFPVAAPAPQIGPDTVGQQTAYTISGAQNTADPFGPVPMVFGKMRIWPRYGASPYTQFFGEKQVLRLLFVLGYGPLTISELKIGETPVEEFVGSNLQFEVLEGYPDDEAPKLYPGQVFQEQLSVELQQSTSWEQRTTADDIDEISVDISAPQGIYEIDEETGKRVKRRIRIKAEYRAVGDTTWLDLGSIDENSRRPKTLVWGMNKAVPRGQYEVRVRKVSPDHEGAGVAADQVYWVNLTGLRNDAPIDFHKPLAIVTLAIKASGQLNSVIDSFNCVVEKRMTAYVADSPSGSPVDSPSGWVPDQLSRNPADQFLLALTGPDLREPEPLENIDLVSLADWHAYCDEEGWEFNFEQTTRMDALERLRIIAASGRARLTRTDGMWGVTWDAADIPVAQHFTPRNSWGFEEQRVYFNLPDAFRINFINEENGYQPDELRVYSDGDSPGSATKFESLEFPGVTRADNIWRMGRFHMAQAEHRPSIYTLTTNWQALSCVVGSKVYCAHDVTMWGIKQGRVKSVSGDVITIDEEVVIEPGKNYAVRFRQMDGTSVLRNVDSDTPATTKTLTLLADSPTLPAPDLGALIMYGEAEEGPAVLLRVKDIQWLPDLRARITLVDDAPEIAEADSGPIPPYNPHITGLPDLFARAPSQVTVTERTYVSEGTVRSDAEVSWVSSALRVTYFEVEYKDEEVLDSPADSPSDDSDWRPAGRNEPNQLSLTIPDLLPGDYSFRVRTRFNNAMLSEWVTVENFPIVGAEFDSPEDVPPIENFPSTLPKVIQDAINGLLGGEGDLEALVQAVIAGEISVGSIADALAGKQDIVAWLSTIVGTTNSSGLRSLLDVYTQSETDTSIGDAISSLLTGSPSPLSDVIDDLIEEAVATGDVATAITNAINKILNDSPDNELTLLVHSLIGDSVDVGSIATALASKQGLSSWLTSIAGAANAGGTRSLLSLVPGTDVQNFSSWLASLSGAANAGGTRSLLSLVPGTDVQTFNSWLASLAGGANAAGTRSLLSLVPGTNVQAFSSELLTLAGNSSSSLGRSILSAAAGSNVRSLIGSVIGTDVQGFSSWLGSLAGGGNAAGTRSLLSLVPGTDVQTFSSWLASLSGAANAGGTRSLLSLVPGTDVQTFSSWLASLSGAANAGGTRSLLSLVPGTDVQSFSSWLSSVAATSNASGLRSLLDVFTGDETGGSIFEALSSALGTLSVSMVQEATGNPITISADVRPGDVMIYYCVTIVAHTDGDPSGWTDVVFNVVSGNFRNKVWIKIAEESDAGASLTGGPSSGARTLVVLRPSRPASVTVEDLSFPALTNADPPAQTVNASAEDGAVAVFGFAASSGALTTEPTFFPDDSSSRVTPASQVGLRYAVYNSDAADVVVNMPDAGSSNGLQSFYLRFVPQVADFISLIPSFAGKQDLSAWLTSLAGASNAGGTQSLLSLVPGTDVQTFSSWLASLAGATNAGGTRSLLSLVPGTDVQTFSSWLASLSGASNAGGTRSLLSLVPGTDVQTFSSWLASLAGASNAGGTQTLLNLVPGTNVQAFSSWLGSLSGAANAGGTRSLLSLVPGTDVQSFSSWLSSLAGGANAAGTRSLLSLVPGTDVQTFSSWLASLAGASNAAGTQSLLNLVPGTDVQGFSSWLSSLAGSSDASGLRSLLSLVPGTDIPTLETVLAALDQLSVSLVSSTSGGTSIGMPSTALPGDVAVLLIAVNGSFGNGDPSGWGTSHYGPGSTSNARRKMWAKIVEAGEPGTTINTGVTGDSPSSYLFVFRPSRPVASFSIEDVSFDNQNGDPPAQVVNASAGFAPVVVMGMASTQGGVTPVGEPSFSPDDSSTLFNPAALHRVRYAIYNEDPADVTVDMPDGGNSNALASWYVQFTPALADVSSLIPLLASKQDLSSWLTSIAGSANASGLQSLLSLVPGTDVQSFSSWLSSLAGGANAAGTRSLLSLVPGTDVQGFSSWLSSLAGATNAAGTQSLLSLVPGTNVQSFSSWLSSLAGATNAGGTRSLLSLVPGTDVQSFSSWLSSLAGGANAAGTRSLLSLVPGTDVQTFSSWLASLAGASNAGGTQTLLNLVPGTNVQSFSSWLSSLAGGANAAGTRSLLSLVPGTDVQTQNAWLTSLAGGANAGGTRSLLSLVPGTDVQGFSSWLASLAGASNASGTLSLLGAISGTDSLDQIALALSPLTIAHQSTTFQAVGASVTIPSTARPGDVMILTWTNNSGAYTNAEPSGAWTTWFSQFDAVAARRGLVKMVVAGEPGTTIDLGAAEAGSAKYLIVFRPSRPISAFAVNDVAAQNANGAPANQTVNASGVTSGPAVVIGYSASSGALSSSSPLFTPGTGSVHVTNASTHRLRYNIYNTSPQDVLVQQTDTGSNNTLASMYLTFTPQVDDVLSLAPQLAGKQNLSAWLTSLAGATNAAGTQSLLSLVPGTNVQSFSSWLSSLAGGANAAGTRSLLSLVPGTDVQGFSSWLSSLAGGANAAGTRSLLSLVPGTDVQTFSSWLSSLAGGANAAGTRSLLALVPGTDVQAFSSNLASLASQASQAFGRSVLNTADAAGFRSLIGTIIGTNVQGFSANLADLSGQASQSFGRSLLNSASGAGVRSLIGAVIGTDVQAQNSWLSSLAGGVNAAGTRSLLALVPGTDVQTQNAWLSSLAGGANAAGTRSLLALVPGTDVQGFSSWLSSLSGGANAAGTRSLLSVLSNSEVDSRLSPVTASFVASATSTGTAITIPASAAAGDIAILFQWRNQAGGDGGTNPTGWDATFWNTTNGNNRYMASAKILTGSDPGLSINGMSGGTNNKGMLVFRPSRPISSYIASLTAGTTAADPAAQVITAASATGTPVLVMAFYNAVGSFSLAATSFSPAADATVSVGTASAMRYKIYNSSPADVTADGTASQGTSPYIRGLYLQLVPAVHDVNSLPATDIGRNLLKAASESNAQSVLSLVPGTNIQSFSSWLSSVSGSSNASGLRSLIDTYDTNYVNNLNGTVALSTTANVTVTTAGQTMATIPSIVFDASTKCLMISFQVTGVPSTVSPQLLAVFVEVNGVEVARHTEMIHNAFSGSIITFNCTLIAAKSLIADGTHNVIIKGQTNTGSFSSADRRMLLQVPKA